ncbi:MAG: hypothetical protein IJ716_13200 [Lachnospiraceae bacterium]|nr:hypothetical protein [Lachnospiraceae bacterium]
MTKAKTIVLFIIILMLSIVCYLSIPYFKIQKLTQKYGAEFENLYGENGFYDGIEYLKILQYRDEKADIYYLEDDHLREELKNLDDKYAVVLYVEENHSSEAVYIFEDKGGQWKMVEWNLIWSYSGSADSFMWPYYL